MARVRSCPASASLLAASMALLLLAGCSASLSATKSGGAEGAGGGSGGGASGSASSTGAGRTAPSTCPGLSDTARQPTLLASADPIELATSNQLAALPVTGLAPRSVVGVIDYSTPDDYLLSPALIADPVARREAMIRDGFRAGTNVAYRSGSDSYGAIVLRFAGPEAAADYLTVHLRDVCSSGATVRPLAALTGVSYLRTDNLAKATFVVGDTEVQLDICSCVEVRDRVALAGRWAEAVAQQLGNAR